MLAAFDYEAVFIFRIAETVYKCIDNTKTTAYRTEEDEHTNKITRRISERICWRF